MYNISILKTSYNMYDCINLSDIMQKLVTKPFTLTCTFNKPCNINKFNNKY